MRTLWKVTLGLLTALVLCAVAVGPAAIRGVWGDGPVEQYLATWRSISQVAVFGLVVLWAFTLTLKRLCDYRFFKRHIGGATPGTLGAIRMLVCSVLLVSTMKFLK